eukprot:GHVN01031052.1.p1 GENE.GHVN01031052.1~~GHVN01031052.1.p1  ORF type:complete len:531 (-),score=119.40 GHVN01031052.1:1392-2861(-)
MSDAIMSVAQTELMFVSPHQPQQQHSLSKQPQQQHSLSKQPQQQHSLSNQPHSFSQSTLAPHLLVLHAFSKSEVRDETLTQTDKRHHVGKLRPVFEMDNVLDSIPLHWYPGFMAKAARQLPDLLQEVDVVLDIRDGRIPVATKHPHLNRLLNAKPRVIVLTHRDQIPPIAIKQWGVHIRKTEGEEPFGVQRPTTDTTIIPGGDNIEEMDDEGNDENGAEATDATPLTSHTSGVSDSLASLTSDSEPTRSASVRYNPVTTPIIFTNLKVSGYEKGVLLVCKAARKLIERVNEKRLRRGLLARPIRALVFGYPNVGKSAMANKLLGRSKAKSFDRPGSTQHIQWIRLHEKQMMGPIYKQWDVLDCPGILPKKITNSEAGWMLAACNVIPDNACNVADAGTMLIDRIFKVWRKDPRYCPLDAVRYRFSVDPLLYGPDSPEFNANHFVAEVARRSHGGSEERAAIRILMDFRKGRIGKFCLEIPPVDTDKVTR